MCLTAEALAVFLNLIAIDGLRMQPGRIIVPATANEAHWVRNDDSEWCTMAPQIDASLRYAAMRGE